MEDKKRCTKCGELQGLSQYSKDLRVFTGLKTECKTCGKARSKLWAQNNPEARSKIRARWEGNNPEYMKAKRKRHYDRHQEYFITKALNRINAQRTANPPWLTEEDYWLIDEVYSLCRLRSKITGIKWHVDHIVPLKGKDVRGLHVPWNLQVITAKENYMKSNKPDIRNFSRFGR